MSGVEEFETAYETLENELKEFIKLYNRYTDELIDYTDLFDYIENSKHLKKLFVRYLAEEIEINIAKYGLEGLIRYNNRFVPYNAKIHEVFDRFYRFLKIHNYI